MLTQEKHFFNNFARLSALLFITLFFIGSVLIAQDSWNDLSEPGIYNLDVSFGQESEPRSVRVHIPEAERIEKFPVIFFLHGTMKAEDFPGIKGYFQDLPEKLKFIGVVTHSLEIQQDGVNSGNLAWNHAPKPTTGITEFPHGGEFVGKDIAFLQHIVTQLKTHAPVREGENIYYMGHSSGGFMAFKMGMMQEDCGGISPSGASFHKGSRYIVGNDGFDQEVDYARLLVTDDAPRIRVVHFQGECDNKSLWDGNLDGNGNTPKLATGGTTDCRRDASQLPVYPILGDESEEGTAYLWVKHNQLVDRAFQWNIKDGTYAGADPIVGFTQYDMRLAGEKDVIVVKIHAGTHAPDALRDMKEDRIKLLLGRIQDLPGCN